MTVDPAEATIGVGDSQPFSAAVHDLHGQPLGGPVPAWTSDAG